MHDYDAIVIGSGAGGMGAAVALARAGKKVIVFEQHYLPGGWTHSFTLDGYQFSPGVHYIGELQKGGMMRSIYEGLGVANDLPFMELNPDGYDHVLIGKERFDIPSGKEKFAQRLKDRFPHEAKGIDAYLDTVQQISRELMSGAAINGVRDAITAPLRLKTVARHALSSLDTFMDRFVQDPLLRAILAIQVGDSGLGPSKIPAVLHASVQAHYFNGGYYPKGGAKAIPRAFVKELKRNGGAIQVRAGVDRILIEGTGRNQKVVGVRLADGTEVSAPLVISNADPEITYRRLVGEAHLSKRLQRRLDKAKYSLSCISLFFAVDADVRAMGLDSGNLWFNENADINGTYDMADDFNLNTTGPFPGSFLTTTTLKDPGKRKDNIHTMESFFLVRHKAFEKWAHTEYGSRPEDYQRMKVFLTERIFQTLDKMVPGLREKVIFHELGTPLTNRFYVNGTEGNMYGTEKSLSQIGPFSFPVKTQIPGLFNVGAGTIGHGVAGATMSGLIAAKMALKCRRSDLFDRTGQDLQIFQSEPTDDHAGITAPAGMGTAEQGAAHV